MDAQSVTRSVLNTTLFIIKKVLFIFSLLLTVVSLLPLLIFGYTYFTYAAQFKQTAGLTNGQIIQLVKNAWNTGVESEQNHVQFLILGTDQLANRDGDPELTDTMMLLSLDLDNAMLRSVSFPRDLWSAAYKTKINALYEYGKDRYPGRPEQFPTEVISELVHTKIHHTIVITLDQLAELVDILGGVTVHVDEGFVDEQFPRSDVNIRTEKDPKKLYMTVEFETGDEKMSGERVLQYVRSRHSQNLDQGTDSARASRQQQVIEALIEKLKNRETLGNPTTMGKIYIWYLQHFDRFLPIEQALAIVKQLARNLGQFSLQKENLPTSNVTNPPTPKEFVFIHPPISKYNQWVYEIEDEQQFSHQIRQALGLE